MAYRLLWRVQRSPPHQEVFECMSPNHKIFKNKYDAIWPKADPTPCGRLRRARASRSRRSDRQLGFYRRRRHHWRLHTRTRGYDRRRRYCRERQLHHRAPRDIDWRRCARGFYVVSPRWLPRQSGRRRAWLRFCQRL